MTIKRWLKDKIRSAAESNQLAYAQRDLAFEVKKLSEKILRIEENLEQCMVRCDSISAELRQEFEQYKMGVDQYKIELDQYKTLSAELSRGVENLIYKVEQYHKELQDNFDGQIERLSAEEIRRFGEFEAALTNQSEQLSKQMDQISKELILENKRSTKTAEELQRLWSTATTGRQVQLTKYRSMKLFMFTNDLIPDKTTEEYRNSAGLIDAYNGILNGCNVLPMLFQHYWKHKLDFTFLDVGCQYGHESILAGQYIKTMGHNNHIFCFDAGQASRLVPFNLTLNGLDGLAEFHRIAIGNDQTPLLMYYEPGYSEHNRSLNPQQSAEGAVTFSYPAACTTLDCFCADHGVEGYLIVKLDTEGSEPFVVEGMKGLMKETPLTLITEYSPSNFQPQREKEYLNMLLRTYELIDIGALQGAESGCERQGFQISAERLDEYVEYVKVQPSGWADILALPRNLPYVEELLCLVSPTMPF